MLDEQLREIRSRHAVVITFHQATVCWTPRLSSAFRKTLFAPSESTEVPCRADLSSGFAPWRQFLWVAIHRQACRPSARPEAPEGVPAQRGGEGRRSRRRPARVRGCIRPRSARRRLHAEAGHISAPWAAQARSAGAGERSELHTGTRQASSDGRTPSLARAHALTRARVKTCLSACFFLFVATNHLMHQRLKVSNSPFFRVGSPFFRVVLPFSGSCPQFLVSCAQP
jgi:hypothetical protein